MFYRPNQRLQFIGSPKNKSQLQIEDRSKSKSFKAIPPFFPKVSAEVIQKHLQNPQQQVKIVQRNTVKQSFLNTSAIKQPKSYLKSPQNIPKKMVSPQPISLNLSSKNLRNTNNFSLIGGKIAKQHQKDKSLSKNKTSYFIGRNNSINLNSSINLRSRSNQKNIKEPPSFLRNKHLSTMSIAEIEIIKQLSDQSIFLVRHRKLSALFQMQVYPKQKLVDPIFYQQFKQYLRNSHLNNRLIARFIGYFNDENSIYIFQEYLHGQEMKNVIKNREQQFNESQLGAKIYDVLTVMAYLKEIGHPHALITTNQIIYTMNTCKFKRSILRNSAPAQSDQFYDIWCLGNMIFSIITGQELIPPALFNESKTLAQIFNSTSIAKCIQKGLKKLQERHLSRELIEFLIASIWTVQQRQITFQTLLNFQFIKVLRDEDIWAAKNKRE